MRLTPASCKQTSSRRSESPTGRFLTSRSSRRLGRSSRPSTRCAHALPCPRSPGLWLTAFGVTIQVELHPFLCVSSYPGRAPQSLTTAPLTPPQAPAQAEGVVREGGHAPRRSVLALACLLCRGNCRGGGGGGRGGGGGGGVAGGPVAATLRRCSSRALSFLLTRLASPRSLAQKRAREHALADPPAFSFLSVLAPRLY